MTEFAMALISALWLGILTAISPCPLAANIAAISFISRRIGSPYKALMSGLLYTAGRTVTYLVVGSLMTAAMVNAPFMSHVLQKYMNKALGPVMIIVGMFLLELIDIGGGKGIDGEKVQKRFESSGMWGAFLLGIVLAAAFCPISAALFFGSLFATAVKVKSIVLVPVFFGIGTGLPVMLFSVLVVIGAKSLGTVYNKIRTFELWARRITGTIFLVIGIYYCLKYIFGLF